VAALAARADRTVRVDLEMSDLRAEPVRAAEHLATDDDPAADSGAERHEQEVVDALRRTVRALGQRRHVGVVVDDDRAAGRSREALAHRRTHEGRDVRRVVDHAVVVDHAGRAQAHRDRVGRRARQGVDRVRHGGDDVVERCRRRRAALVEHGALPVDHRRA
jgi:hypothetical protein